MMRLRQLLLTTASSTTLRPMSSSTRAHLRLKASEQSVAQGVHGRAQLVTGNFSYFTKYEAHVIRESLEKGKTFVIVFDRDTIAVPANERAMWIREHFKHHPDLEVRVAYAPPLEKEGNEDQYIPYIKKQIPAYVRISAVLCGHRYSVPLASSLGVKADPVSVINDFSTCESRIKQNPAAHENILLPMVINRVLHPFKETLNEYDFQRLCETEKVTIAADIERRNSAHPNRDSFFKRTRWDLSALNKINFPVVIGNIGDEAVRANFSKRTNVQVFDMPIYMPGQGWKIPVELAPYQYPLATMVAAESLANPAIADCNTYITVDCGVVFPHGYARREGLHLDGFLTKTNRRASKDGIVWGDHTYIVSDSPYLQTEFYPGPFYLSNVDQDKPEAVLEAFAKHRKDMLYHQGSAYDITRLTTNNVHAVHPNLTGLHLQRCFMKVTFSERLFNRGGNTVNPGFNYRFMYVPRQAGRNTQNFIGLPPEGFVEVDLRDLNFSAERFPQWTTAEPFQACKNPAVRITAVPATEGEMLETVVDGQIVTTNIAKQGDMKVTRANGDSYFLGANFARLYRPLGETEHAPTPRILSAIRVAKNISFLANWGTRQNIPSDGVIVQDECGETWGVHPQSFAATYLRK